MSTLGRVRESFHAVYRESTATASGFVDTVKDALVGAIDGAGELAITTAGAASIALRGTINGVADLTGDAVKVVAGTAESAIGFTRKIALEVEEQASKVGTGAVMGAKDVGMSVEEAASGAVEGAKGLGQSAVHTVRDVLGGTIERVRKTNGNGHTEEAADTSPSE